MITRAEDTRTLIDARSHTPVSLFVIGCSTGGPSVLHMIIPRLPSWLEAPVVVVQHMPVGFVGPLAQALDQLSSVRVSVAGHGTVIRGGEVWLAPPEHHVEVQRSRSGLLQTVLSEGEPVHGCMPAVDPLARSAARIEGDHCVLIVLTGMGRDGHDGAEHVARAGGLVVAQDAGSSRAYGMPRAVYEGGLAHAVLPPPSIASLMRELSAGRSCA